MRLILTVFIFSCLRLQAQDYPREQIDLSKITDELTAYQDADINYDELLETYLQLYSHPLDLNKATPDELRLLNILSEEQITSLQAYRKTNGSLVSIYELQAVEHFDSNTIYKLIPFVTVSDPISDINKSLLQRIYNGDSYLITRYERTLQQNKGFNTSNEDDEKYQGSPDKLYLRYRASKPGDYSIGFTAEKDAGEEVKWQPNNKRYGADFYSYHAQVQNKKRIANLILGDYQCQFGQGLLLGSTFGFGKGGETITTARKSNIGFMPYTSAIESGFMRGAAGTFLTHRYIHVSAFYSSISRDASVDEDDIPSFSSFNLTGFHRNEKEIAIRKKVKEANYGTVINFKKGTFDGGLIIHGTQFSVPILKKPSAYNQFAFNGENNINTSIFLSYIFNNVNIFSEAGKSFHGGKAWIAGALMNVHPKIDLALVARSYDKNFYSFYGNAFSENTTAQNEKGIYWGWKYKLNRRVSASAYIDLFSFPWLKFRAYRPGYGDEFLVRLNYQPSKKVAVFTQFRQERKQRNTSNESNLYLTNEGTRQNFWLNVDYEVYPNLRLKTRAQFSTFSCNNSFTKGMVLLQDLSYTVGKFQITGRHALFDTDDYDNRQYVYENDVWLAFSLPLYYGVGVRNYIVVEYKFNRRLGLWLRYARTTYTDRQEIGSGLQQITGNKKEDVKLQLLVKF